MWSSRRLQLEKLERVVLWVTTLVFPLLVLPGITQDEFKAPKMAILLLGVGLAGGIRLIRAGLGTAEQLDRRVLSLGAVLIACLTLSWLFSDLKGWALIGQYYRYQGLLPYILFVLYGTFLATAFRNKHRSIAWAFVAAGSISGLYSLIQAFQLDPLFFPATAGSGLQPAFSTVGNTNFAGGWHAVVLPIAVGLAVVEKGRSRDLASMSCVLISLGLAFSFSQGAWVAAAGAMSAFTGLLLGRSRPGLRTAGFLAAGTLGLLLMGIVISVTVSSRAAEIFGPTIEVRAAGWEQAIQSWTESPLVGRGPNTFALFSYQYSGIEQQMTANDYVDDPHSVPLFFLASTGIVGAAGYACVLLLALWFSVRTAVRSRDPLMMGVTAGVIAYALQILVSIDDPTLRLAFWGTVGAVSAGVPVPALRPKQIHLPPSWKMIGGSIAAVLVVATTANGAWRFFQADRQVRVGVEAGLDNEPEEATTAFETALALRSDSWYRFLAGKTVGELANRRAPAAPELFAQMAAHFSAVSIPRHPRDLYVQGLLTTVWAEKADNSLKDEGLNLLRRAHRLDPGNLTYAIGLAEVLIDSGKALEAVEILGPYRAYNPEARFWNTWVLANATAGNHQEAWATIRGMKLTVGEPRVARALDLLFD